MFSKKGGLPRESEIRRAQTSRAESSRSAKSPNIFEKLRDKISEKYAEKKQARQDRVLELKKQHLWTDFVRETQFPAEDSVRPNCLERFLLGNFSFKNAFNRTFVQALGEDFLQSCFCVPVLVGRHQSLQLRMLLNPESGAEKTGHAEPGLSGSEIFQRLEVAEKDNWRSSGSGLTRSASPTQGFQATRAAQELQKQVRQKIKSIARHFQVRGRQGRA